MPTVSMVLSTSLSICRTGSPKASSARSVVLREAEIEPARRMPEGDQDAYDLTSLAFPQTFTETPERNEEALRRQALEIDPAHAMANALAAWRLQQRHLMDWAAARPDDREKARRPARVAIARGSEAPSPLAPGGTIRASLTRDHDLALSAVDHAMINTQCRCGSCLRCLGEMHLRGLCSGRAGASCSWSR
jgi:hypothetical protein